MLDHVPILFEGHQLNLYPTDLTTSDYILNHSVWIFYFKVSYFKILDNLLQDQERERKVP